MISKIILFTTALLTVKAQEYSREYSTSSNSLISQDNSQTPRGQIYTEPIVHRPALLRRPFPLHLAPVYENVVEENTPAYFAPSTPIVQEVLPSVNNVAPNIHYAYVKTPVIRYAASFDSPNVNHVSSIQHHKFQYHYPVLHQEYTSSPEYEFKYRFKGHHTGNFEYQQEKNDGYYGTGHYSPHKPVSSVRTVLYDTDKHSGFSAVVDHSQLSTHVHPSHHNAYSSY